MKLWRIIVGGVLLVLVGGCEPKSKPDVVARVGSREIRAQDVEAEMERRQRAQRPVLSKQDLLEEMIEREALIARAVQAGLDMDGDLRRSYENQLIGKLKQQELEPRLQKIDASPIEVDEAKSKLGSQPVPESHLAILQIRTHPRMSEPKIAQVINRLNQAREQALKLPPEIRTFGELSVDFSEDQATRYNGGDAGWFQHLAEKYQLPSSVLNAGYALKQPGEISDLIRTTNGVFLVRLIERRLSDPRNLGATDELARHRLLLQKRKQTEAEFVAEAKSSLTIARFPQNLEAIPFKEPTDAPTKPVPVAPGRE